ncbi:MAG: prepilin peptidase [Microbacteriaceae bacterium]|nr:prepilin peptidase [Microbacteriaceae bacterium]
MNGVTAAIAAWAALAAYLWFVSISIALSVIDFELQRLPDAIVLPSIGVVAGLLSLSAVLGGNWAQLIAVIGGAAALFVFYFVIVLVYPKGMGGGDVKLAPVVGAALGYIGWDAVIVGGFAGFAIGAIVGLVVMAVRRVGRKHALPFGPWMLAGAWLGIVLGPQIMLAYLRLVGLQ